MDNIVDHIVGNIKEYLNSNTSNGAFLLKGEWGSGKTYFVKNILSKKIEGARHIQVMISLFGLESVNEIPFKLLNAYINAISDANDDMNRGLDYLDKKYGQDRKLLGINLHDEDELIYNIIPKDKVYLCFDDVERFMTRDNVEEIMGTINNLVENIGYKVIVISNDNYQTNNEECQTVKSLFKEKLIGNDITYIPDIPSIYEEFVQEEEDIHFSAFMKRDDILGLFLPEKRNKAYHKDFVNIRNMKFAISNFYDIFNYFRETANNEKTIERLKYYLAFVIGVSIEYKKDILKPDDMRGIDVDIEILNFGDDEGESQNFSDEMEETPEEKEQNEKKKVANAIYRKNFYKVYAKDMNQMNVFHEEIYNKITKGTPIDFIKLEDNLQKKVFDKDKKSQPGNLIVTQTLDGSIYGSSNDEIKGKMQTLVSSVEDGSLMMCAAYVNAFSFLDIYKNVIGKTHEGLLEIFKTGFSKYVSNNEISINESTGLKMVAESVPDGTKEFYDYLLEEIEKNEEAKQKQGIKEMMTCFETDIPRFCSLFMENNGKLTSYSINEPVLQNFDEKVVMHRMHNLTPKDVFELSKFVIQRYTGRNAIQFQLQKEKKFLNAMKNGVETIDGEDTVSKVQAKKILLKQVENALINI